jgi:hypothetical protein
LADRGEQFRLGLVGYLRRRACLALQRKAVDETPELARQVVSVKILRLHLG